MPNISAHMSVADYLAKKLNIDDPNFIIGNLLPDLEQDKTKSHYKIQGKLYLVPNISYVEKILDLKDKTNLGILTHLLLDSYYLDYLTEKYPNIDVFDGMTLYKGYDYINQDIINHFNLDVDKIINILLNISEEKYIYKRDKNIKSLKGKEKGNLEILEKDDFIKFLDQVIPKIEEDIVFYVK